MKKCPVSHKNQYTKQKAETAILQSAVFGVHLRAYVCPHCKFWHLSSTKLTSDGIWYK